MNQDTGVRYIAYRTTDEGEFAAKERGHIAMASLDAYEFHQMPDTRMVWIDKITCERVFVLAGKMSI